MSFFGIRRHLTAAHKEWWTKRKIDWKTSYLDTWNVPHRSVISQILSYFPWVSLIEIGCGGGANIYNILKHHKGKQLGGVDVNADAIEFCSKTFVGGMFKVCPANNIMMSDKSVDVTLTDRCLMYVDPSKIGEHLEELKRITRNHLVIREFHSKSWWTRVRFWLRTGYGIYDWKTLLQKHGFYDISWWKLKGNVDNLDDNLDFDYIFVAKVPKR